MYPSTIDGDCDTYSTIVLRFRSGVEDIAILRIASPCTNIKSNFCKHLPEYVDGERSGNVFIAHTKEEIDSIAPIVFYCGNDPSLSNVLLLEETGYELELEILVDGITDEMQYLRKCGNTLFFKANRFGSDSKKKIYQLYSKSYVGKGYFDIEFKGTVLKIPFEVRSKKIEYISDYPRMLGDIAEYSAALILDHSSPLFRNYSAANNRKSTAYEDYLVLEYIFNKLNFETLYEYVINNLHTDLRVHTYEEPSGNVTYLDPSCIMSLFSSNNLFTHDRGIINGTLSPNFVSCVSYDDTYDTPENRLIKDLLLLLQSMIYALKNNSVFSKSDYISSNLLIMMEKIDGFLSDKWLLNVGPLTNIPFESPILQKKYGYAEMFEIYQLLGVGIAFSHEDVPSLFEGHNKKVYEVYEYWCFIRLYRALYRMSENKPKYDFFIKNGDSAAVTIRSGKAAEFIIVRNNCRFSVKLYYNKNFDQTNAQFRSYSIRLRPDYTLLISRDNVSSIINFDAKYKLKPKPIDCVELDDSNIDSGCWEYDIYKMHTYRDALIRSLGSYVLYPGPNAEAEGWQSYIKPGLNDPWDLRYEKILPSVGAISLTPGSEDDVQLNYALETIFGRLSEDKALEELRIG